MVVAGIPLKVLSLQRNAQPSAKAVHLAGRLRAVGPTHILLFLQLSRLLL